MPARDRNSKQQQGLIIIPSLFVYAEQNRHQTNTKQRQQKKEAHKNEQNMSIRGVWQLTKLTLTSCDRTGTSKGCREFVQETLPKLITSMKEQRSGTLEIVNVISRGRDPHLLAEYANGRKKSIGLKNRECGEVEDVFDMVMNEKGRVVKKIRRKVFAGAVGGSVQGVWQPDGKWDPTSNSTTKVSEDV